MMQKLSQTLNLRLNGHPILMGKRLNLPELGGHGIKKVGLLGRLLLKHEKGEVICWAKACTLEFIDSSGKYSIAPADEKESSPDHIYGTSAFLHYTDDVLRVFAFQVMNNPVVSEKILHDFEAKITGHIGEAPVSDGWMKHWKTGNEKLVIDYPTTKRNGYLHLILGD